MTKPDKRRQKGSTGVKQLRDKTVIAKAMEGMKTSEIAEEVGMSRQQVSKILNSDEVKAMVKEIDNRLASGIGDAITTVLAAVKMDYKAAYDLLKNFGSMKTSVDMNHRFPKPTVIERPSGSQVVLGAEEEEDK